MAPTALPFRPIASTLIRKILVWSAFCVALFAAGQAVYSYFHVKNEFQAELQNITETNIPMLSINLFDIEPHTVQKQLENIARGPHIGFVRLTSVTGPVFVAGLESTATQEPQRFDIPAPVEHLGSLGRLEIYENPMAFGQELAYTLGLTLLGYLLLTLVICSLTALVLRRELQQPMRQIADFVSALKPQSLTTPLHIDRPNVAMRDEIDLVVAGFQVLQQEVNGHIANLDQLVIQRTQDLQVALGSIQQLSLIDPLTQCFNRRGFDQKMEYEVERTQRYDRPLSLAFGDIDFFKRINDSHGHTVGDRVLQGCAECLRVGVRSEIDWIARFGGEEFVIVMPETDLQGALLLVERLRLSIEQATVLPETAGLNITISFGVAQYQPGDTIHTLVQRADTLLYAAKGAGRNTIYPAVATSVLPPDTQA